MIYEEGKFLFSDPLYYYLPEWKNTQKYVRRPNGEITVEPLEKPITIRDAVAMMCGLPYCMMPTLNPVTPTLAAMSKQMEELLKKGPTTIAEEVHAMANIPVMFEPGSHWLYGLGFRTLLTQKYGHNGHLGNFGWTGGTGIWVEADPTDKFAVTYIFCKCALCDIYILQAS